MIIKEVFICAFGKLENERFLFDDGCNCKIEKNGYGKTTLLTFIKTMLYGIEDGKRSVTENERKRYLPWRGGIASGYMVIEVFGNEYRIERSFGKRSSEDELKVYDLKTGKLTDRFSERPGADIFEIDKDGFERTVFLSEGLLSGKIENDTVSGKLGGLVGARYDIGEYENAVDLLDESKKRYIKRGGGGEIAEVKEEIFECESRLKELSDKREAYSKNLALIENIKSEQKNLNSEREKLVLLKSKKDAQARRGDEIRRLRELSAELDLKEARLREIDSRLGKNPPTPEEILKKRSALISAEGDLKRDATQGEEKPSLFKRLPTEAEIIDHKAALKNARATKEKSPKLAICFLILLGIILDALGIFVTPYFYIGAGACIALALIFAFSNSAKCKSLNTNTAKNCRDFLNSIYISPDFSRDLDTLLSDAQADLKKEQERLATAKRSEEERLIKQKALAEAMAYFNSFGLSPEALAELTNERALLFMDIKTRREILDKSAPVNDALSDEALSTINPDEQIRLNYEKITACERELSRLSIENERLATELSQEEQIRENLEERRERLTYCEERVRVIDTTKELLVKAKNDMTARYLDGTKKAFLKYIEMLGEEGEFTLDTSFDIKKYDSGASREREAYSKGSRELYSFALRLALIDTLYRDDKPPIIIDDAFMSLDDAHLASALKLLRELALDRQILYFTCAGARGI